MIALIDNYDSFTYNLAHALGAQGARVWVVRNDEVSVADLAARVRSGAVAGIVIGPGPADPPRAGISLGVVSELGSAAPVLGVCLGHQAIAHAFGGRVVRAARLMHGKTSPVLHDGRGLFAGLPSPFEAMRYHSLAVDPAALPAVLEVAAWTAEGEVMALRHRALPIEGVQFHPESVLTRAGGRLLANWLQRIGAARRVERVA